MQLYAGAVSEFSTSLARGELLPILRRRYSEQILSRPSESELRSWQHSLTALDAVLTDAAVPDAGILIEHMLPLSSKRIDAFLFGLDSANAARPLVIELKQWTRADIEDVEGKLVVVGGRLLLHPQQQVAQYVSYLRDFHPMFHEGSADLAGSAFLHNSSEADLASLRSAAPAELTDYPLFGRETSDRLGGLVQGRVGGGGGTDVMHSYLDGKPRASKRLLEHVAHEIEGHRAFVLVDDQLVAYEATMAAVDRARRSGTKGVVVVTGGPGSGKSVIAVRLLGELAGQGLDVSHATGSRSFTLTLRKLVTSRSSALFRYFNSFGDAKPDQLDALICDEAHRIRATSNSRYTPRHKRSTLPQVDELIQVSKVSVFLLDEDQVVRPDEIGTVEAIEDAARRADIEPVNVELDGQFRVMGSEAYVAWVAHLLGIADGGPETWDDDDPFELTVADSPAALEAKLAEHHAEGHTARMAAGFCWPWSNPRGDGTLIPDVRIGEWARPWNAKPNKRVTNAPPAEYWASDPAGFGQVGCIYTAQGFEYDYGGVLFGRDMVWRSDHWEWNRDNHADPVVRRARNFDELVRNVYKVLLTRSLRGCVVFSEDPETQKLFGSLIRTP